MELIAGLETLLDGADSQHVCEQMLVATPTHVPLCDIDGGLYLDLGSKAVQILYCPFCGERVAPMGYY